MKKWMPIRGDFFEEDGNIVFKGMIPQSTNSSMPTLFPFQPTPDGMVLFEDAISIGEIEASIKFDDFGEDNFAQIVFSYQNDYYYMCAGVTNISPKYGFYFMNGQLNPVYTTGHINKLDMTEFHIRLQLIGSFLSLYVNETPVSKN